MEEGFPDVGAQPTEFDVWLDLPKPKKVRNWENNLEPLTAIKCWEAHWMRAMVVLI